MKVRRGFTLIEVVTVIGIFTLLSALVISNLQRGKQTQVLRETSQRLVDDVRQMQNKT
ncbi:MAG: type II secretion system protein GspG, partial [Candidatus Kerfeldbacteria bacterium CG08_land_8_20_14_0_20_42_7]